MKYELEAGSRYIAIVSNQHEEPVFIEIKEEEVLDVEALDVSFHRLLMVYSMTYNQRASYAMINLGFNALIYLPSLEDAKNPDEDWRKNLLVDANEAL